MDKYYYKDEIIDEEELYTILYNHYIQIYNELTHEEIMDIVTNDVENNFLKYNSALYINEDGETDTIYFD
jgi:hypothetical protein